MARLQAALRTSINFYSPDLALSTYEVFTRAPETVSIEFEGRQFVWHASEPSTHDEREYWGPTLAVMAEDKPDKRRRAEEAMERLLSAISFAYDTGIEVTSYGADGEPDPRWKPSVRDSGFPFGRVLFGYPERVEVDDDHELRIALGHYREARNAGSPFYRFLAFWNALEAACGDENKRAVFVKAVGPRHPWGEADWPRPPDLAAYLWDAGRNAIAHVLRSSRKPRVDPDLPQDRRRLEHDGWFLRGVVREAIETRWPSGVRTYRRLD